MLEAPALSYQIPVGKYTIANKNGKVGARKSKKRPT